MMELQVANDLKDQYSTKWYEKFGREPVMGKWDFEAFKWIGKTLGREDAMNSIDHFFKMREEWFIEKAYSVPVWKENINKILASMSKSERSEAEESKFRGLDEIKETMIRQKCDINEARKLLHLHPDGVDDWMVKPPFELSPRHFEQWKKLRGWTLSGARAELKKLYQGIAQARAGE